MLDLTQLPGSARECVEVFAEQSRMALDPVREVVDRFRAMDVDVTFSMIVRGLNQQARKTPGEPGTLCWALVCYLQTREGTPAADLFDLAVSEGVPPMVLLEELLGCSRGAGQDDGSVRRREVAA